MWNLSLCRLSLRYETLGSLLAPNGRRNPEAVLLLRLAATSAGSGRRRRSDETRHEVGGVAETDVDLVHRRDGSSHTGSASNDGPSGRRNRKQAERRRRRRRRLRRKEGDGAAALRPTSRRRRDSHAAAADAAADAGQNGGGGPERTRRPGHDAGGVVPGQLQLGVAASLLHRLAAVAAPTAECGRRIDHRSETVSGAEDSVTSGGPSRRIAPSIGRSSGSVAPKTAVPRTARGSSRRPAASSRTTGNATTSSDTISGGGGRSRRCRRRHLTCHYRSVSAVVRSAFDATTTTTAAARVDVATPFERSSITCHSQTAFVHFVANRGASVSTSGCASSFRFIVIAASMRHRNLSVSSVVAVGRRRGNGIFFRIFFEIFLSQRIVFVAVAAVRSSHPFSGGRSVTCRRRHRWKKRNY